MATRHDNNGLRKLCACQRRTWPKCAHPWHFNYKPRGGAAWRFSLDVEIGRRIESKTEAEKLAADIRAAINAGTYERAADRRAREEREAAARRAQQGHAAELAAAAAVTLTTFAPIYLARVSEVRARNKSWKNDRYMFAQVAAFMLPDGSRLGDKALGAITEDDLEAVVLALRTKGRATSTRNQYVQLLKKSFRWATKKGYTDRNPTTGEDSTLTRGKIAKRHRRLAPDVADAHGRLTTPGEERRLLGVAGVRLQWLIIAALETACRLGELLALTWADVNIDRKELTVRAETAKDEDRRVLPISARLAGVLEMAKTDPTGAAFKPGAFVFGELGVQVKSAKRAWQTAVLKAVGHTPEWIKGNRLSPASRAAFKAVDLHFHDLRHEGASRMLEAGWPLHHIQHMLGHASLEQTSTYLNVEKTGLQDSMRRFGVPAGIRCNPVAIAAVTGDAIDAPAEATPSGKSFVN